MVESWSSESCSHNPLLFLVDTSKCSNSPCSHLKSLEAKNLSHCFISNLVSLSRHSNYVQECFDHFSFRFFGSSIQTPLCAFSGYQFRLLLTLVGKPTLDWLAQLYEFPGKLWLIHTFYFLFFLFFSCFIF